MEAVYILGIETSCDETSVSIVKNGKEEIGTITYSQIALHQEYGGVVPELASRNHVEKITLILDKLFKETKMEMPMITAIAVTFGPGLIGSLLIGVQAAKTLAFIYQKPLVPVHHICGHIYANRLIGEFKFPLLALVVSGGHNDLILMKGEYKFQKIGGTLDDAAGEAYDKVARVLGLNYPGGPVIEKKAKQGEPTYKLPLPLDDESYNFSFSGLKSAVINLVNKEKQKGCNVNINDLACSFQRQVIKILVKKTMRASKQYQVKQILLAGGVAANQGLRQAFKEKCEVEGISLLVPPLSYCTDNATMISTAGYYAYKEGIRADLSLNAQAIISYERE